MQEALERFFPYVSRCENSLQVVLACALRKFPSRLLRTTSLPRKSVADKDGRLPAVERRKEKSHSYAQLLDEYEHSSSGTSGSVGVSFLAQIGCLRLKDFLDGK